METACCDLHTHTTASDGSYSPQELVKMAAAAGLKAIAVTDHDTMQGISEAMEAGKEYGVEVIAGMELSVLYRQGDMHILGYYISPSPLLTEVLQEVQQARARRNPLILEKLAYLGCKINMDELADMAQGGQIGRPHIAQAMVNHGFVSDTRTAFAMYLKKGGPAYAPKSILSPKRAIEAIHSAGGLAVLAHPFSLHCNHQAALEEIVAELKTWGIDGMECYYSEHDPSFTEMCLRVADRYDLVATGGSDFHGRPKPNIQLGKGKGNLCVPYECVILLRDRLQK
ncbi:MAG: PHP domain-containing protein [Deltaproteobacteria bacterium]|nr:PHP domain-containing protein [Deltaproteobacteria bacterium]